MSQKYFTKLEALDDIKNAIGDPSNYNTYELFNNTFNCDYYIIGTDEAEQAVTDFGNAVNDNGVFSAIEWLKAKSEEEGLSSDELMEDIDDPERVANLIYFFIGLDTMNELMDTCDLSMGDEVTKRFEQAVNDALAEEEKK